METYFRSVGVYFRAYLETFLVEWKLVVALAIAVVRLNLETFLVEWKLFYADGFKYSERPLKPS